MRRLLTGLSLLALSAGMSHASGVPLPQPRPVAQGVQASSAAMPLPMPAPTAAAISAPASTGSVSRAAPAIAPSLVRADVPRVKEAIARIGRGDLTGATQVRNQISDPAARTLVEWLTIRGASRQVGFERIAQFLDENAHWPSGSLVRRRAEEALYLENVATARKLNFFNGRKPQSALGRLAYARTLSNRTEQARVVRAVWRSEDLTTDVESRVMSEFGTLLTADDHAARADYFFYKGSADAAMRHAARAGSAYQPVARARAAVVRNAKNADQLLAAVPSSARKQPGYVFARVDRLLRQDKIREAQKAIAGVPRNASALVDSRSWWEKRRWLARDLLDLNDPRGAYEVAAGYASDSPAVTADAEFHAGWIALRFLKNPATARQHFVRLAQVGTTPITTSRAYYWLGRTEEAAGNNAQARTHFSNAAQHGGTYYGQLARAKLGMTNVPLRGPQPTGADRTAFERDATARALSYLYAAGARDQALSLFAAAADEVGNPAKLVLLADLAEKNRDPRSALTVGKTGLQNGHPVETIAWPTSGIPNYKHVGPAIEPAVVHAIARQESAFHIGAVSSANARGLLQMLPATAQRTARSFGVPFDAKKLTTDAVFNAQLGAAHLGELAANYDGSYILTFVAYNAGPRRVTQWIERYGDPRDPRVDPVDWVERIPFQETRNYVQRVMENVQVYRARLGNRAPRNIEADLRRGSQG